jgi:hypothetical protein
MGFSSAGLLMVAQNARTRNECSHSSLARFFCAEPGPLPVTADDVPAAVRVRPISPLVPNAKVFYRVEFVSRSRSKATVVRRFSEFERLMNDYVLRTQLPAQVAASTCSVFPPKRGLQSATHSASSLSVEQRAERSRGLEAFLGVLVGNLTRSRLAGEVIAMIGGRRKQQGTTHCAVAWKPLARYLSEVPEAPDAVGENAGCSYDEPEEEDEECA